MNIALCISWVVLASIAYSFYNAFALKKERTVTFIKKGTAFSRIVFALIALELGGSMMLSTCESAYSSGLYGLLYVVGFCIGFLLLGLGFASKMKAMNVENTIDLFEIRYKSPLIRISAAILSILTTGGLLVGQIVAAKSLVHTLGINSDILFICFSAAVILYALWGGLRFAGLAYNFQLVYTVLLFSTIFGFCIFKEPPSFFTDFVLNPSLFDASSASFSAIFSSLVMPALYYLTDQEFASPLFTIAHSKKATVCALSASIFMLLFSLVPIYFGIKAKALHLVIEPGINPLIPVLKILTNDALALLAVAGMAAALIALIDYYLWSLSLSITHELGLAFKSLRNNTKLDKSLVVVAGIAGIIGSYCTTSNALNVLLYSYELYDSCLIVPLLMSYFQTDLKKGCAIGAFLAGLGSFIIFRIIIIPIPTQIASLVLSLGGFYLGGMIESIIRQLPIFKRSRTCSV